MLKYNSRNRIMRVLVAVLSLLCFTVTAYAGELNWIYKNNTWYAIENKILLKNTWVKHKENYYYLDSSGKMSTDTLVDGYYVALDGRYVVMNDYDVECNKIIQILKSDNPNEEWEPTAKDAEKVISNLNNNRLFGNTRLIGMIYTNTGKRVISSGVADITAAISQYDYVNAYLNSVVLPIVELKDRAKIEYINKWIINRFEYSYSNLYSVYDAIVLNETVCNGYAAIFKSMCNKVGIRCDVITGTADNTLEVVSHAWNKVYLQNKEYYFDLCWNDILDEDKYYFMTYEEISVDHFERR